MLSLGPRAIEDCATAISKPRRSSFLRRQVAPTINLSSRQEFAPLRVRAVMSALRPPLGFAQAAHPYRRVSHFAGQTRSFRAPFMPTLKRALNPRQVAQSELSQDTGIYLCVFARLWKYFVPSAHRIRLGPVRKLEAAGVQIPDSPLRDARIAQRGRAAAADALHVRFPT